MAKHSELGYFVRGYQATVLGTDGPADTGACRDSLVNNARHLHDESGQVIANLAQAAGEQWQQEVTSTTEFGLIDNLPPVYFPLRRKANGDSYSVVTNLRASISAAGTATFRIQLWFQCFHEVPSEALTGIVHVVEVTTTSTSATDLATQVVYMPAALIAAAGRRPGSAISATMPGLRADGSLGSASFLFASLTIWAKSSSASSFPRIHGLTAREYVAT